MAVELQIESNTLANIITRALQNQLNTTCFPSFGEAFVDHANVAPAPVTQTANAGAVRLHVPIDVFVVLRAAVLAAPNGVPAGATSPAGRVTLILELRVTGTAVSLTCVDVDLGSFGAAVGPAAAAAKAALIAAAGSPLAFDLSAAFTQIGLPPPASSRVDIAGGVIAIRFDPAGGPVSHLFPGLEWGLFLDGPAVERLAVSKVPADFRSRMTSLQLNAFWRPNGSVPHVDVDYSGKVPVPDPFACDANGTFRCDFGLTPGQAYRLRTTVNWTLHLDLGALVPGFIDNMAEEVVISSVDPAKFGGVALGKQAFAIDSVLPAINLAGSELRYTGVLAAQAGMTIGGPVRLPLPPRLDTVKLSATAFGLPSRIQFCSQLAKSGSGAPLKSIRINDVTTNAGIFLEDAGKFCGFEVLAPGAWLSKYIFGPAPETEGNTHNFNIQVPGGVAGKIKTPARLIVTTARGVRLADLGVPPEITVDINGQVTNAIDNYIDDCLYIDPDFGLKWGHDDLVIPLEHPDWRELLTSGLDVQLVTLNELDRGELVQFRSAHHQIDVTADQDGRAMVPVLLSLTAGGASAQLTRTSRRPIGANIVQSAIFDARAMLASAPEQTFTAGDGDTARLTSRFSDRIEVQEMSTLGLSLANTLSLDGPVADAAMPSTGPTKPAHPATQAPDPSEGLPDVAALVRLPGFEDAPIAITLMKDGAALVLDLANPRRPRVAGTFKGPIGAVQSAGNWALASAGSVTSIFRVSRSPEDDRSRSCNKCPCESHE